MFHFFKPTCPVDAKQKVWIECRLAWLCRQFGLDRMRAARLILPADERFSSFAGTEASARTLFKTICGLLEFPADEVALEFHDAFDTDKKEHPETREAYEELEGLRINASDLADGQRLVARMVHIVARRILEHAGHANETIPDFKMVADLFAVYSGFGIFSANAAIQQSKETGRRSSLRRVTKLGALAAAEVGYALAVFCHVRHDHVDDWPNQYLRLDARSALVGGLKYIERTGDCLFQRMYDRGTREPNDAELLVDLASEFDGNRIAALEDVRTEGKATTAVALAAAGNAAHKNRLVCLAAIRTLARLGPSARGAIPVLIQSLQHDDATIRAEAADAVGEIQADGETLAPLVTLLSDSDHRVVLHALRAIDHCGPEAATVLNHLEPVLRRSLIDCNFDVTKAASTIVLRFAAEPGQLVHAFFEDDVELQLLALAELTQLQSPGGDEAGASQTS